MVMRVSGKGGRRTNISGPSTSSTRPLTALIRRSLIDQLRPILGEALILDLFSGSGSFGMEALGQGASHATFVELRPETARVIQNNLTAAGWQAPEYEIVVGDVMAWVSRWVRDQRKWSVVFVDPPFEWVWPPSALELLFRVMRPQGRLLIRRHWKFVWPPMPPGLFLDRERRYGESMVRWYRTDRNP